MELLYRGAYDDNWKDENIVKHRFLLTVLKSKMADATIPSIGCSIKWVSDNFSY